MYSPIVCKHCTRPIELSHDSYIGEWIHINQYYGCYWMPDEDQDEFIYSKDAKLDTFAEPHNPLVLLFLENES